MDEGSDPPWSLQRLPLDMHVPQYALKRRFGISFCSSSSYFTEPRFERRGAISFERTDKNAIYIRMLGDVKMRECPDKLDTGQSSVLADADRKMLDKLALPDERPRFRSRFLSTSKAHRHRKSHNKLSTETRLLLDEFYHSPARLLLSHLGDWNFNIFSLDALSAGRSLFHVAYHLFQTYDLIRGFQLDTVRLMQFFSLVEENYHETNPYHNAIHAADVTQSMHCYLQERQVYQSTTDLEKMAALVASLTHDLDHPGVNNTFLIVTSNHLATLYQNISVLENHHWRSAVGLLQETGLLCHLTSSQRESFYHQLKALILATDITRQQEFLLKFTRYIESGEFQCWSNEEHRQFLLQIALKCADISNPCRPWKVSQRWSRRICKEFFLQGDTERALNVAVTPLCDRFGNTIANIQHGFIQFVVSPLFKAWDSFLGTELSAQMMSHMTHNQAKWKSVMELGREVREEDTDSEDDLLDELEVGVVEKVTEPREETMEVICNTEDVETTSPATKLAKVKLEPAEHEEEEEGKSEEDDVVENDVNLVYHYPTEVDERCLSPVSEDNEQNLHSAGTIRRYSVPYVVRKDLNFYLGLRKDSNSQFHRRQSLPASAMYFHSSSSSNSGSATASPRSLSMDALLTRPKIISLSPSVETSLLSGGLDPLNFTPLKHQTLMLQGGTLTRFTTNPNTYYTGRRASYEPILSEQSSLSITSNLNSDLEIPPYGKGQAGNKTSTVGLASSWPSVTQRRTTNGSTQHHTPSSNSSVRSINAKSNPGFPGEENAHIYQQPSTSSHEESGEEGDSDSLDPGTGDLMNSQQQISPLHNSQCLSLSSGSPSHDSHNLSRPQ